MSCSLTRIEYQDVSGFFLPATTTSQDACGYTKQKAHARIPGLIQYMVVYYVAAGGSITKIAWATRAEYRNTCSWLDWFNQPANRPETHGPYITSNACALIRLYFEGAFDIPPEPEVPPPEEPPVGPEPPPDPNLFGRIAEWTLENLGYLIDQVADLVVAVPQQVHALVMDSLSFMDGIFDDIKDFISGVSTAFTSLKDNLIDAIKDMWANIEGFFEAAAAQIKNAVEGVVEKLTEIVGDVWEWIKDLGNTLVDGIKTAFSWVSEHMKDLFSTVWNAIKDFAFMVKDAIVDVYENLKKAFVAAWEWVRDGFINIKDAIIEGIKEAIEWVKDTVKAIVLGLTEFFSDFMEALEKLWVGFTEWWEEQWNPDNPKIIEQMMKYMQIQRTVLERFAEEKP